VPTRLGFAADAVDKFILELKGSGWTIEELKTLNEAREAKGDGSGDGCALLPPEFFF